MKRPVSTNANADSRTYFPIGAAEVALRGFPRRSYFNSKAKQLDLFQTWPIRRSSK